MQWRFHSRYFAVYGDEQTGPTRFNRRFFDAERFKILGLFQAPNERAKGEPEEPEATGPMG